MISAAKQWRIVTALKLHVMMNRDAYSSHAQGFTSCTASQWQKVMILSLYLLILAYWHTGTLINFSKFIIPRRLAHLCLRVRATVHLSYLGSKLVNGECCCTHLVAR